MVCSVSSGGVGSDNGEDTSNSGDTSNDGDSETGGRSGGSGSSNNNNNNNDDDLIITSPILKVCEDGKVYNKDSKKCECIEGLTENASGDCVDNYCNGGKIYNLRSKKCECPKGMVEDSTGNCVKKPCGGDPVANVEIAPQLGDSGMSGGLHNTCTRTGSGCSGEPSRKVHDGVDLKNPYGAPIFAMYDGTARLASQYKRGTTILDGAGYHVSITSTINGNELRNVYFHLQKNGRASGIIKAGDIIGYQGLSGNLGNAIKQNFTTSHLHVKTRLNGVKVDPLDFLATKIDSNTGTITSACN